MTTVATHSWSHDIRFPPGCCACRESADRRLEVTFSDAERSRVATAVTISITEVRLEVPICDACKRRHELSGRIASLIFAGAVISMMIGAAAGLASGLRWGWIAGVAVGIATFFALVLFVVFLEERAKSGRWGWAMGFDAARLQRLDFPDPKEAAEILGWYFESAEGLWRLGRVKVPTRWGLTESWEIPIFGNREYQREFDELNGIENRLGLPFGVELIEAARLTSRRR